MMVALRMSVEHPMVFDIGEQVAASGTPPLHGAEGAMIQR
jgi:hypothetical protein